MRLRSGKIISLDKSDVKKKSSLSINFKINIKNEMIGLDNILSNKGKMNIEAIIEKSIKMCKNIKFVL